MTNKLIDMHMHTTYSDGELSPNELIKKAIDNNIGTIAITDHNSVNGLKAIEYTSEIKNNINIINGVELSAKVDHGQMHILGYDFDINNEYLNNELFKQKENSLNYILSVMEQIKRDYKIIFGYYDIVKLVTANHNLGRPDLAKLCVEYGFADNIKDAFTKYLNPAKEKIRGTNKRITYEECIHIIKEANGIPVLAHPKSLELSEKDFLILLRDLIKCGLMGIEVFHSSHSKEEMDYYLKIANEYNLLISGGSDYHGEHVKPDTMIGTGVNNNLKIKKLSLVDYIKKR